MNIKTQLAQFTAAEEAAAEARAALLQRLDDNATVILNTWRKRFQSDGIPMHSLLEWTSVYRKPGAVIRLTQDDLFPVTIDHDGTTYRIPASLFYGSTWDIAKATRQICYRHRWQSWISEQKRCKIKLSNGARELSQKTERIQSQAKHEIAQLARDHERDMEANTQRLALRERQIANMQVRFAAEPES